MVKVVVVNGRPESGKTTFEKKCVELCGASSTFWFDATEQRRTLAKCISTVDFVKAIALRCGWTGEKTLKDRKFLSDLKDLLIQWNDIPFKTILEEANKLKNWASCNYHDWILFVDCREPEEIQKLKERLNATTVLVRRLGDEINETSNHADANVFEYEYDYTIKNYGDLDDLAIECEAFLDYMKTRESY